MARSASFLYGLLPTLPLAAISFAAVSLAAVPTSPADAALVAIDTSSGAVEPSPWRVEFDQPAPILGPRLGASAWWSDSVGAVLSARVLDANGEAGPQAVLADACAAWRLARTSSGSLDVLGGARVAAASDEVGGAGGLDLGSYRGESQPIVGVSARQEPLRGVVAAARADVSPRADGSPAGWSVGGGLHVELDRTWRLSIEASVGSLDRTLSDALGTVSPNEGRPEGAVWIGLSRSF